MVRINKITGICLLPFLAGCVYQDQVVSIKPEVTLYGVYENVGQGKKVSLRVADERPDTTIGVKGFHSSGGQLISGEETIANIHEAIADGLRKRGYVVDDSAGDSLLDVELRGISYRAIQGLFAGTLKIEVAIRGSCMVGGMEKYKDMYRGNFDRDMHAVQTEKRNEQHLNKTVGDAVSQLLGDQVLMACLAG